MNNLNTEEKHFVSAEALIDGLRGKLISTFPAYCKQPGEKLVRLVLIWREALLYRIVDLASASIAMFREGRLIPGCALTRSLYETVAQFHYLHKKLSTFIDNPDIPALEDFIKKGSWGSKDQSTQEVAFNVLTAIGHLNKEFPGAQEEYFHLCEYAHPNFKGGIGTYTYFEIPSLKVEFGLNPHKLNMVPFGLGGLNIVLTIARAKYDQHISMETSFKASVYTNAAGNYLE